MSEKQNDKAGPAISQDGAVEIDEAGKVGTRTTF